MSDLPRFLSESAQADQQAVQPFPHSRKVYLTGSQPDIRIPVREISLSDTVTESGSEKK